MSILTENIKLYNPLNNRFLIYNCIILLALFSIIPLSAADYQNKMAATLSGNNQPFFPIMFLFMSMFDLGGMIALIQTDIMTKPFAMCLPDLHKISFRVISISGLIFNLIYLAVFIYLPAPNGIDELIYYTSILTCGLFFYTMAAYFTLYIQYKRDKFFTTLSATFLLLCLVLIIVMMCITYLHISLLLYISIPILALCLWSLFALLKMIVNPNFKRVLILNDSLFNLSFSAQTRARQIDLYKMKKLSSRDEKKETHIEIFFVKRLEKLQSFSLNKLIFTKLYYRLNRFYNCNTHNPTILIAGMLIAISIIILLSGYHVVPMPYEKTDRSFALFLTIVGPLFLFGLGTVYLYLFFGIFLNPEKYNHLFPEGRSEHFCSSIIIWLLKPVLIITWMSIIILIAKVLDNYIPGFMLAGINIKYNAPGFSLILWALIIIPVMDIFMFNFEKPCSFIIALIFLLVLLALSLYSIFAINPFYASTAKILAIVISNGFFIERLWHYWFKKDIE